MTGHPYPPFSGDEATCPKCGGLMDMTYHPAGTQWLGHDVVLVGGGGGPEWLMRTCQGCDYRWAEMCRDAYPETALRQERE